MSTRLLNTSRFGTLLCGLLIAMLPGCLEEEKPANDAGTDATADVQPSQDRPVIPAEDVPTVPNGCAAIFCPVNTYCGEINGQVQCIPFPTCANTQCPADAPHCTDRPIQCVTTPCPPSSPVCSAVPPSSCAAILCLTGSYCDDSDGSAECIPFPTCTSTTCAPGTVCRDQPVECIRPPCPPTIPQCYPVAAQDGGMPTTCADIRCQPGTYCDDTTGHPVCQMYPTCASTSCGPGQVCEDVPIQCFRPPCPPTTPQCSAHPISCSQVLCPTGTYCDDSDGTADCFSYATCGPMVQCPPDRPRCTDEPIVCVTPPCPPTAPVCSGIGQDAGR